MSKNIENAMNYSWMSQASYLDLVSVGNSSGLKSKLENDTYAKDKRFAAKQAEEFVEKFDFVDQQPNTNYGMSSTVFKNKDDGSYTFAVRGTEPPGAGDHDPKDLLVDLFGVVLEGQAKIQIVQAFHHYKKLTTAQGEKIVYTDAEAQAIVKFINSNSNPLANDTEPSLEDILAARTFMQQAFGDEKGLGLMMDANKTINFTGHSLGGHVAYLLGSLIEETQPNVSVGDVMTYNSPGEGGTFYEVLNWLRPGTTWSATGPIGSKHIAFYGDSGLEVTALEGRVIGTPVPVYIEGEKNPISLDNHSINVATF